MKFIVLIVFCIGLIGCSDNNQELMELQLKHDEALAELRVLRERESDNDKNAFAAAISTPSIDERYEALNRFVKAYPSSSLVINARQEIQNLEKLMEKRRQRDQEIAEQNRQTKAIKLAYQREQEQKKAEAEKRRLAEKKRCIDRVRNGIADIKELNIALMGMTELELVSLLGRPDRVEQKREFYYYRGIGIETATGKKRGIIVTFGGGVSLEPLVNMVRWRI